MLEGEAPLLQRVAIFLIVSTAGFVLIAKDQNSFEGKWVVEKDGTTSTAAFPEGLEQRIKQDGANITIESRFKEPKNHIAPLVYLGIMTTSIQLRTDTSEVQNQIGPFQQASKTAVDGNKMTTEWKAMVNGERELNAATIRQSHYPLQEKIGRR